MIYSIAAKGLLAHQLSRDLAVPYKTAFVLMHKRCESLMVQRDEAPLAGEVQLDVAYMGGSVCPANRIEDRVDRRLVEHQNPDKRCVLVMRETYPVDDLAGRVVAKVA